MAFVIAVDIGGTFTDLVAYDHKTGEVRYAKFPTTYGNFTVGIKECMRKAAVAPADIEVVYHGTTLVINALIQRRGAKAALIATKGFRDVIEIGRGNRPAPFDLHYQRDPPLVPRELRLELGERMASDGTVVESLDEGDLDALAEILARQRVEAVAISFMNSYGNPDHEERAVKFLPPEPGNFSAVGMLMADARLDTSQTFVGALGESTVKAMTAAYAAMEQELQAAIRREIGAQHVAFVRVAEMRYRGQRHNIKVPIGDRIDVDAVRAAFDGDYERRYGHADRRAGVEIQALHLAATAKLHRPDLVRLRRPRSTGQATPRTRAVYFESAGGFVDTPLYDRFVLAPGFAAEGPADRHGCARPEKDRRRLSQSVCRWWRSCRRLRLRHSRLPIGKRAIDRNSARATCRRGGGASGHYAFGYESAGGFQKAFEACGGKVIQKIWPPLGNKDFGPFIPTIKSDADVIYSLQVGPAAPQFPKQLREAGVKLPIVAGGTSYDDYNLPYDSKVVIGDVSALMYSAALQTPKAEAFVKGFRSKYGQIPGYYAEANYTTAQMIDEAVAKNGGKFPGPAQFLQNMVSLKIDAARGPVSFDDMRNPIENVYIRKVEKTTLLGDSKPALWNVVIKTYPNVGQFWTYGKDKFLRQPVYSRDFPPCKHCE